MDSKTYNEYILRFNPANASRDQIQVWLYAIIDEELNKKDNERNQELIKECSDFENFLFEADSIIEQVELESRLNEIKQRATNCIVKHNSTKENRIVHRRSFKIALVFAAVLLAMALSVGALASHNGMTAIEFIEMNIDKIKNMNSGDFIEGEGITLVKGGKLIRYNTIEELLSKNDLDILYPSVLPEGVVITEVNQNFKGSDDYYSISFKTNSGDIQISARNHTMTDPVRFEQCVEYKVGDQMFYMAENGSAYIANCQYGGFEYYIQCSSNEVLELIITNMKGLKK